MIEVRTDKGIHKGRVSWVKKIIAGTLKHEKRQDRSVSVLLTDNRRIRRFNRRFLRHDYATDVISFGLGPFHKLIGEADYLGDLVVSVQMAKNTASSLGIPFGEELARYLVHGTLHLLGYDDKKLKDRTQMIARQESILRSILRVP